LTSQLVIKINFLGSGIMKNAKDGFYVMAFYSVNHSIQTEITARKIFAITVIPTPRELVNDCGIAIKFDSGDLTEIETFHKSLTVPANIYFLSNRKINGKREVEKLI